MKLDIYKCRLCLYTTFCEAGQQHLMFLDVCPKCGATMYKDKSGVTKIEVSPVKG